MKSRNYQTMLQKVPKANKGGGTTYVEDLGGITIEKMYARMIAKGEVQKANDKHGSKTRQSKNQAYMLTENAKEVPNYMSTGTLKKEIEKMNIAEQKISNLKNQEIKEA